LNNSQPVTFSARSVEVITASLKTRKKGLGIRFGTKTAGCSGQAYIMEFVDVLDEHDVLYNINNMNIIIDNKSLIYLKGLHIDYKRNGLNEGFEFINPNATGECGCGESFTV